MTDYEYEYERERQIKEKIARETGTHPDNVYRVAGFGEQYATTGGHKANVQSDMFGDRLNISNPGNSSSSSGGYSSGGYSGASGGYYNRGRSRGKGKGKVGLAVILAIIGILCMTAGGDGMFIGFLFLLYPLGVLFGGKRR